MESKNLTPKSLVIDPLCLKLTDITSDISKLEQEIAEIEGPSANLIKQVVQLHDWKGQIVLLLSLVESIRLEIAQMKTVSAQKNEEQEEEKKEFKVRSVAVTYIDVSAPFPPALTEVDREKAQILKERRQKHKWLSPTGSTNMSIIKEEYDYEMELLKASMEKTFRNRKHDITYNSFMKLRQKGDKRTKTEEAFISNWEVYMHGIFHQKWMKLQHEKDLMIKKGLLVVYDKLPF